MLNLPSSIFSTKALAWIAQQLEDDEDALFEVQTELLRRLGFVPKEVS